MEQVVVSPFGIQTTRFGFGCSSLLGLRSNRESRALIDAAYDAGIRHFDVARSYGHGAAEALLGSTLGSRRANVTITSKFGIPARKQQLLVSTARALARPFVKRLSGFRARSNPSVSGTTQTLEFTASLASQSLETTLRELRSDYVDLFLLHEPTAELLNDDRLLEFLHFSLKRGMIRGHGVGSERSAIPALIERKVAFCPVVQHEWSLLTEAVAIPAASSRICHGALLRSLNIIENAVRKDHGLGQAMNEAVGTDVMDREQLAPLLLRGAALRYPDSITLFSARNTQRIQRNVESLSDARLDPYCARLADFVAARIT